MNYVLGLGNYSMGDDGIGLRIIEEIEKRNLATDFEAVEVANNGMQVLTFFEESTDRILVIDCAYIDRVPGDYLVFAPDDVESKKVVGNISTHEGDILKLIELARQLEQPIPDIRILAIQPESTEMAMELSPTLAARINDYVDVAVKTITNW